MKRIEGYKQLLVAIFTVPQGLPPKLNLKRNNERLISILDEALESLPKERMRKMVRARFGLDSGAMTWEAIGREFGVTRERPRQIFSNSIRMLRHPSRSKELRGLVILPSPEEVEEAKAGRTELLGAIHTSRLWVSYSWKLQMHVVDILIWSGIWNLSRLREAVKTGQINRIKGMGPKSKELINSMLEVN